MRKFKFFKGIIDNSWIFHAGFPQHMPVESQYHTIDTETELTRILVNEITTELDNNMTTELDNNMTTELNRNWNGGQRA